MKDRNAIIELAKNGRPLKDVLVIDGHSHLSVYPLIPSSDEIVSSHAPEDVIVVMDRLGIAKACISGLNDSVIKAVRKYPDRFIGFATVNPNYPDNIVPELKKCFRGGMTGIGEIVPAAHEHNYPVTGENYLAVWEFAEKENCPVLVHSGPTESKDLCGPQLIAQVAKWYPSVNFIIGHSGGYNSLDMLIDAAKLINQHHNLYGDICGLGRFFGGVELLTSIAGSKKVIFGSDGPFECFTTDFGAAIFAKISDEEKHNILGLNMLRLLGD